MNSRFAMPTLASVATVAMLAVSPAGAQDASQVRSVETEALEGRKVRVRLRVPVGAVAGLSELQITGALRTN